MTLESQDGFVETIYPYLWLVDPLEQKVPSVQIPDTIIYKNNNPVAWYFTMNGQIKYKTHQNLNSESILECFLKKNQQSNLAVALFIEKSKINNQNKLVYNYMDVQQFKNITKALFMNDIYSIKQGILQRFIPSKGDRYNVYRCTWSSHMCFFEKIENKWLMNSKVDLYQKIITYEDTNAHVSISCLQGKTLINKIETLAYDIVSHLKNVSIGKLDIGRMQMIFLMNHKEQLYMLGCTSIRLMHHKRQNFSEKQMLRPIFDQDIVCLPQKIDRYGLNSVIAEDLRKEFSCVYCEEQFNTSNLHEVTFKNIIQAFGTKELQWYTKSSDPQKIQSQEKIQHFISIKQQKQPQLVDLQENYGIPMLIRKLMPSLRTSKFKSLSTNPGFLLLTVSLCSNCFMTVYDKALNTYTLEALCRKTVNDPTKILGTQKLKPERTNELFMYTRKKIERKLHTEQSEHLYPLRTLKEVQGQEYRMRQLSNLAGQKITGLDMRVLGGDLDKEKKKEKVKPISLTQLPVKSKWFSSERDISTQVQFYNNGQFIKKPLKKFTRANYSTSNLSSTNQFTRQEIITELYK